MANIISIDNLSHFWADSPLFSNLTFGLEDGERVALVARNGAGKTTLLNIMAGLIPPGGGNVTIRDGIKIGYLLQNPIFEPGQTVLDLIFSSDNGALNLIRQYQDAIVANDQARLTTLVEKIDAAGAWDFEHRVKQILTRLEITNMSRAVDSLSGGELRRVALAAILVHEPILLFLDEPTNHLDIEMTTWLENYLTRCNATLLMVTHDRYFLDRVCTSILELDGANLYRYKGNYSYFVNAREERCRQQVLEVEKARNLLRKEQEWMNRMPQARATKAKYRIDAFHELKEVANRKLEGEKIALDIKSTRLGTKVVNLFGVSKKFDTKTVINNFSYKFARGEKIGVIGKNGAGKSTLLDIISGGAVADIGNVETGETVQFGYYRQQGISFEGNMKVIEAISAIASSISLGNGKIVDAAQFLRHFLFPNEMHHVFISKLSGGEKKRLYLMTVLMKNPNFLILDEPTNDLDIFTLAVLENYLANFNGCVLVVSHDRYFLDNVVDQLLVFEDDGVISQFPGNYSHYLKELKLKPAKDDGPSSKAMPAVARERESNQKPRRATFKEKQELIMLEEKIASLEEAKSALEVTINSGKLDPDAMHDAAIKLGGLLNEINDAENRWVELSMLNG